MKEEAAAAAAAAAAASASSNHKGKERASPVDINNKVSQMNSVNEKRLCFNLYYYCLRCQN